MMKARTVLIFYVSALLQFSWALIFAISYLCLCQSVLAETGLASNEQPASSRPGDDPAASSRPGGDPAASSRPGDDPAASLRPGDDPEASSRPSMNEGTALPGPISPAGRGKAPPVVVGPQDIRLFFQTAQKNFSRWDLDHDKQLSSSEVNHAIFDPRSRADIACVLAAFHSIQQKARKAGESDKKITLLDLKTIEQDPKQCRSIVRTFIRAKRKLSRHSVQLFASGAPHLSALHQGKTGDCYFLAALGAMTVSRPQDLRRLIKEEQDGKYTVQFPGTEPITVSGPGDAEFATFAESGDDGIWLNVLEKAFGTLKMAKIPEEDASQMYDKISGGSPAAAIRLITGHRVRRYHFNNEKEKQELRAELAQAMKDHRLVTTSVRTMRKTGKTSGHALAVVSFNPLTETVQIWNPWGTSVKYKDVGVRMEEGLFTMPVNDWLTRFSSVAIEGVASASVSK